MKENDLYAPIRKDVAQLHGAVVMKHADRFTRDIPDFEVCYARRSSWAEIKYRRPGDRLRDVVDRPTQVLFAHQLAEACGNRGWFLVYEEEPRRVVVWQPRVLFGHLWPNVAGPDASLLGTDPVPVEGGNLAQAVSDLGVIAVPWGYDVFRRLIAGSPLPHNVRPPDPRPRPTSSCAHRLCPAQAERAVCGLHAPEAVLSRARTIVDQEFAGKITDQDTGLNVLLRQMRDRILRDLELTV